MLCGVLPSLLAAFRRFFGSVSTLCGGSHVRFVAESYMWPPLPIGSRTYARVCLLRSPFGFPRTAASPLCAPCEKLRNRNPVVLSQRESHINARRMQSREYKIRGQLHALRPTCARHHGASAVMTMQVDSRSITARHTLPKHDAVCGGHARSRRTPKSRAQTRHCRLRLLSDSLTAGQSPRMVIAAGRLQDDHNR